MRPTEAEFIWGRWQGSEADPCTPPNIRAIISHLFSSSFPGMGGGTHGTGHTTKQKKHHPPPTKQIKKKKNQTHKRSSLKHIWWDKTKWCTPSLVLSLTLSSSKSPYHVNITSNLARVWFYTPRMFHFIRHHSILTSVS